MKIDDLIEKLTELRLKHGPDVGILISSNCGHPSHASGIIYSEPKETVFVQRNGGPHVMIRDWTIRNGG